MEEKESKLVSDLENYSKKYPSKVWFTLDEFSKATGIEKKELFYLIEHESFDVIIENSSREYSTRQIYKDKVSFLSRFRDNYSGTFK